MKIYGSRWEDALDAAYAHIVENFDTDKGELEHYATTRATTFFNNSPSSLSLESSQRYMRVSNILSSFCASSVNFPVASRIPDSYATTVVGTINLGMYRREISNDEVVELSLNEIQAEDNSDDPQEMVLNYIDPHLPNDYHIFSWHSTSNLNCIRSETLAMTYMGCFFSMLLHTQSNS